MTHVVIVGGGLAAASAAETLWAEGFDGDVTIVADEPHPPYQRPPLSKGYLAGKEGLDAVFVHPAEWYAENGMRLRMSTAAVALDPASHRLDLAGGESLTYDALLLATGSSPRRLPIPGADLPGVRTLRRIDDSDALAAELKDGGRRLVLIGSGWIGLEVAATAREFGNEVTVLERDPVPLAAALGAELGTVFLRMHQEHGVDLRMSVGVERITGEGRADGVVVDGETVPADLVLVGVGAVPNTGLADAAGLDVQNGILVDASLRTSAPDVFAAGDVANAYHPVIHRHLRSEHWANALNAGPIAARAMLGQDVVYDAIPYFYTDQYDLGMELSGYPPLMSQAGLVIRGDLDAREFIAFWVEDEPGGVRVVGGMNVNVWDVNETVQALIRSGERVDAAALADPAVPLETLVA
jgi:3-phenylpropionate/trans-cinnamate dioxygenase ferredoxin reductase subunit